MAAKKHGVAFQVSKADLDVIDRVCELDRRSRPSQFIFMAKKRLEEIEAEQNASQADAS